jgi:hypothetical protein
VLEYDVHARDADALARARFRWVGADAPTAGADGRLSTTTSAGELALAETVAWTDDAHRRPIASRHVLHDDGTFGIASDASDGPVCVDPGIVFSGWLGGSGLDAAFGVAKGTDGAIYVAGETASPDFPATPGAFDTTLAGTQYDAFVAKLAPDGASVAWATYLGGRVGRPRDGDRGRCRGLRVHHGRACRELADDARFVRHVVQSMGRRVRREVGTVGVVASVVGVSRRKLEDRGYAIAVDASGAACVTGKTQSADYPLAGGGFSTSPSNWDVMLTKVNPSGTALLMVVPLRRRRHRLGLRRLARSGRRLGTSRAAPCRRTSRIPPEFRTAAGFDAFGGEGGPDGRSSSFATRVGGPLSDQGLAIATAPTGLRVDGRREPRVSR